MSVTAPVELVNMPKIAEEDDFDNSILARVGRALGQALRRRIVLPRGVDNVS